MNWLAAVVLVPVFVVPHAANAEERLGRLFFTPQQRATLDAGRTIAPVKQSRSARPSGPREIRLDGIVTRSDGERTVWINNKPYQDRQPNGMRVTVRDPARAEIRVGGSSQKFDLQVGEVYDRADRKVKSPPGARQAEAKPGASGPK